MGKFGKYKMLLGEPCRCYFKNNKGEYIYHGNAYYIGEGCCVSSFTDVCDKLPYSIMKFDRCIPMRLWNTDYQYAKERGVHYNQHWNLKEILLPGFGVEDFNTDVLEDYYEGHLNEFWWWKEIQTQLYNFLKENI